MLLNNEKDYYFRDGFKGQTIYFVASQTEDSFFEKNHFYQANCRICLGHL